LINFVSNLPKNLRSGEFSAMNAAAFSAISRSEASHYVVQPASDSMAKSPIQIPARSWFPGRLFSSPSAGWRRLLTRFIRNTKVMRAFNFFHGFTPWNLTSPPRPYIAWSDCTFRDYIDIFHCREQFRHDDLERIGHVCEVLSGNRMPAP
jgi:hypothetical protein